MTYRDFVDGGCKWIEGHPGLNGSGWNSCGTPVRPGTSWCPTHGDKIYRPATEEEIARRGRAQARLVKAIA